MSNDSPFGSESFGLPLPTEIGGYHLVEHLGSGGMGEVYKAFDADGRRVAFKLLHPWVAVDPRAKDRLEREVNMLRRVRSKYVVRIMDAELDEKQNFLVTEIIEGPTLDDDIKRQGPYTLEEIQPLAQGIATALQDVHNAGVVHRDLKPGNVMLTESGPMIIDFGIAQVLDDARLTRTGMVTGTPGFLDPDVVIGGSPTVGGDWWSWAALLVFASTGRPPFGRGSAAAILARVEAGRPDIEGIPWQLSAILRQALHPEPKARASYKDILGVINALLQEQDEIAKQIVQASQTTLLPSSDFDLTERTQVFLEDFPVEDFYDDTRFGLLNLEDDRMDMDADPEVDIREADIDLPASISSGIGSRIAANASTDFEANFDASSASESLYPDHLTLEYLNLKGTEKIGAGISNSEQKSIVYPIRNSAPSEAASQNIDYQNIDHIYSGDISYLDLGNSAASSVAHSEAHEVDSYKVPLYRPKPRRILTFALWIMLISISLWRPLVASLVYLASAVIIGFLGECVGSMQQSLAGGARPAKAKMKLLATWPLRLLSALRCLLPGVSIGAGVSVIILWVNKTWNLFSPATISAAGIAVFLLIVWIMPWSEPLRVGIRFAFRQFPSGSTTHWYLLLLFLLLATINWAVIISGNNSAPSWWPISDEVVYAL